MATNADRNNVKPVFRRIAPMVVVPCLFATGNAYPSGYSWQRALGDGVHYGVLGVALVWIANAITFVVINEFFGMIPLVPLVYLSTLVGVFSCPSALVLSHARFAPRYVAITITLVWLKLRNRLTCSTLRTSLGFHFAPNNNARHAAHVKLPRPHIRRDGRSYQYSTRACGLGNSYCSTEGLI